MVAAMNLLGIHGGRVLTFCSNLCSKGVGILKSRNHYAMYNTDNEGELYQHTKEHDFYTQLGNKGLK